SFCSMSIAREGASVHGGVQRESAAPACATNETSMEGFAMEELRIETIERCVDCGAEHVPGAGELVCLDCEIELLRQMCAQLDGELEHFKEVATMAKRVERLSQIRRRPESSDSGQKM
ncbi:MAG TPA: hypothetical protein VLA12_16770, partial [Planctomycetaceae bacterium]|nr:hypothetical protein [Planctomycetaceae bacterium]